MPLRKPSLSCQPEKLSAQAVAAEIGITPRQLARLANKGIPGVQRGPGRYQFIWLDTPEIRRWIAERKRFRKGNRKLPAKPKRRLSKAQSLARAIRLVEKHVFPLAERGEEITTSERDKLGSARRRLAIICGVLNRILSADSAL